MPQSPVTPPAAILARMRSVGSSSPRLVWHGPDGRIELSGRVFDNWVAKSANLLVDELDAAEGTRVALDLPVHWKTLALAFACWQVGAVVVPDGGAGEPADIVFSSSATERIDPPRLLVCVALGSLAMRWEGTLPAGAVDFAAEVRSHGDVYDGAPAADGNALLVSAAGLAGRADDLVRLVARAATDAGATHAAAPGEEMPASTSAAGAGTFLVDPAADLPTVLGAALVAWREDASLLIVGEGAAVTQRMISGERVTGRLVPA
ncbi:TIGR03089 family protein [Arthrobacter agilis]|uniref:TIGR03089 family protein n=1 Tax=Arthrobacter agilis TaxID=37921 RepID=UPI0023672CAF|nr:TIGR03089 family protein [Arthrobacter agilis]WDF34231.1 TIGR03089 family protein [Arthrobacter agilis]